MDAALGTRSRHTTVPSETTESTHPGGPLAFGAVREEADSVWGVSMSEAYERWLVPTVFRPFAADLALRTAAHAPRRVLELAAGTGALTRELVDTLDAAEVIATDLNEAMVGLGRVREPRAEWRRADAMQLPFEDGEFDVVACQFGVMFFPNKPAAFTEARRVLTPAGTLIMSTWGRLEEHDFQAALVAALEQVFPDDPPTFMVAVPHGYADLDAVVGDLSTGGLRCVHAEAVTLQGTAASAAEVAAGYCKGTPLRAGIEARGELEALTALIMKEMERQLGSAPVTGQMTAHVVEATPAP